MKEIYGMPVYFYRLEPDQNIGCVVKDGEKFIQGVASEDSLISWGELNPDQVQERLAKQVQDSEIPSWLFDKIKINIRYDLRRRIDGIPFSNELPAALINHLKKAANDFLCET